MNLILGRKTRVDAERSSSHTDVLYLPIESGACRADGGSWWQPLRPPRRPSSAQVSSGSRICCRARQTLAATSWPLPPVCRLLRLLERRLSFDSASWLVFRFDFAKTLNLVRRLRLAFYTRRLTKCEDMFSLRLDVSAALTWIAENRIAWEKIFS